MPKTAMFRRITKLSAAALAAVLLATGVATQATANANTTTTVPAPSEDRLLTTPVNWHSYSNLSATEVQAKLDLHHARPTDIRINSVSPLRFTVTMIDDTGSYHTGYWWYHSQTRAQVDTLTHDLEARPTTLQRYATGEGWRYVVVMVPNTGALHKTWEIHEGTADGIGDDLEADGDTRLAQLTADVGGTGERTYTAIAVSNAGGFAWWWYPSMSGGLIESERKQNGAFVADLDPNSDGTFNVVMYKLNEKHWFRTDQGGQQLIDSAVQHGARLVDMTPYTVNGQTRYAGIMVDNITGLSAQVRDLMDGKVPSGDYGFRFAEAGGAVLAGLRATAPMEPGSSIKVLYHLDLLNEKEGAGPLSNITANYKYKSDPNPLSSAVSETGGCSDDLTLKSTTNMEIADQQMMRLSDNRMTSAVGDALGGSAAILGRHKNSLGLKDTVFNHPVIGCQTVSTDNNVSSLPDLARVWEAGFSGTSILGFSARNAFADNVLNEDARGDAANPDDGLCDISDQEGDKLGMQDSRKEQFCEELRSIFKPGGLKLDKQWVSTAGIVSVPFRTATHIEPRFYTFGFFFNNLNDLSGASAGAMMKLGNEAYHLALRKAVHDAWLTW